MLNCNVVYNGQMSYCTWFKTTICKITYMTACNSVNETCGEFWIQK